MLLSTLYMLIPMYLWGNPVFFSCVFKVFTQLPQLKQEQFPDTFPGDLPGTRAMGLVYANWKHVLLYISEAYTSQIIVCISCMLATQSKTMLPIMALSWLLFLYVHPLTSPTTSLLYSPQPRSPSLGVSSSSCHKTFTQLPLPPCIYCIFSSESFCLFCSST